MTNTNLYYYLKGISESKETKNYDIWLKKLKKEVKTLKAFLESTPQSEWNNNELEEYHNLNDLLKIAS